MHSDIKYVVQGPLGGKWESYEGEAQISPWGWGCGDLQGL